MDKSLDLDQPIFRTPIFPFDEKSSDTTGTSRVFNTLEEAFEAFDKDDELKLSPYVVKEVSLPPIPLPQEVVSLLMKNALLLIDSGEYALARNVLGELLKRDNRSIDGIRWMGWCFKQEEQLENALKCYEQLILLQTSDTNFFELGEIYYLRKNDKKAIESWVGALGCCNSESPHLFDLYKGLGNAFTRSGDYESAEENYNKALTIRPRSDVLQVNIGTLEYQRQEFLRAMGHYKQALEINPHNDRAWSGVALVARQMKDNEWAKATLLRALDINPYNTVALEVLVNWAEADKSFDDAVNRIHIYTEKYQNNGDMIAALAGLLFQKNDLDGAEAELIRLEALDSQRPEIFELRHLIAQRKLHGS